VKEEAMNNSDTSDDDAFAKLSESLPVYLDGDVSAALFHRALRMVGLEARIEGAKGIVIVSCSHGERRMN
jgi:hypothetical protein